MENHYNCRQAVLCGTKGHCLVRALNVFKFITVHFYKMFCMLEDDFYSWHGCACIN